MLKRMIKLKTIALIVALMFTITSMAQQISIIPEPVSMKTKKGTFVLDANTSFVVPDQEDKKAAEFFTNYVKKYYGITFSSKLIMKVPAKFYKNYILISTKKFIKAPDKDGYNLDVNSKSVTISGDTYSG